MSDEVNPDVLAQMHRIHKAANDGTFDKDTINDALKKMHDCLTGAAYETAEDVVEDVEEAGADEGEEHPAHARKPRKKR